MLRLPMNTITNNILQGDVNAALFGGPALVDGVRGKALSFNGVDQYAVINPHEYVIDVNKLFTLKN